MPQRDAIHNIIRQALLKEGWEITDDPYLILYLAVADKTFDGIFSEPIGELVMPELPMKLLIVDVEAQEVKRWIPPRESGTL